MGYGLKNGAWKFWGVTNNFKKIFLLRLRFSSLYPPLPYTVPPPVFLPSTLPCHTLYHPNDQFTLRRKYKIGLSAGMECVSKDAFYQNLETLKQNQRRKTSPITLFIDDQFYDSAKEFLKCKFKKIDFNDGKLTKLQTTTLHKKKWLYHHGKVLTTDQKEVIPKSQLSIVNCQL